MMSTALELSREEWQVYIDALSKRPAPSPRSDEEKALYQQVLARVKTAAELLRKRFKVENVILFGSLTNPEWFSSHSDVDLAVVGLADADYWTAWRSVEEVISDRDIDLVTLEHASESLKQVISEEGILL
jgi:predicted nucleotidyltransferase